MPAPSLGTMLIAVAYLAPPPAATPVDYRREVKPILSRSCYPCHGALRQRAKLRLDTADLIRKGGRSGPAIVPGKSAASLLIDAVTGKDRMRMPPAKEGPALAERQIAVLKAWIDQGARAPAEPVPEDPRKHWAFQKPIRPALPGVSDPAACGNPIDRFVAAVQEKAKVRPRPMASKETLLRRVTLDLIGLPPTRAELRAFRADTAPDAYEKVVDRLLASPRHGERWARHWMDVWRYSDWYGRRAVPDVWNSAPQIWRWRDWIVRSLNADKGYDEMVRAMLAADEIAPEDDEAGFATGYLVRNWYALNPNQWKRDVVEHTGKAFLGLTFNCCHCHDHKYDPISQEEYFRFRAFFEPLGLRQDRVAGEADPGPFQKYSYSVLRKVVATGAVRVLDENLAAPTLMYRMGDERDVMHDRPPVSPGAPAFLGGDHLKIEPITLPPTAWYPGFKPFIRQEEVARCERAVKAAALAGPARLAAAQAELAAVQARLAADDAAFGRKGGDAAALARAAGKAERLAALRAAEERHLLAQAALKAAEAGTNAPAKVTARNAAVAAEKTLAAARKGLQTAGTQYAPFSPTYPRTSTGRRRALALWMTSRDNPLTARVAVNHIWMRYFQRPLVETVFDFGRNGKRPTHPQLLDWLAVELMDSGWSMKHLHRLIVTSDTYKRESGAGAANNPALVADPDNRLLWRFNARRIEAEAVRDSILYAAGQLDQRAGGPPLDNVKDAGVPRRSLYFSIYPEGGGHLKFLELFDPPDPCDCYRRTESIVPQQALALTNSQLIIEHGRLLTRKLSGLIPKSVKDEEKRQAAFVGLAFEQILTREPTAAEVAACASFLGKQERLYGKAKGQPGKGAGSEAAMRARESLVRVLFNHDDFVTVR